MYSLVFLFYFLARCDGRLPDEVLRTFSYSPKYDRIPSTTPGAEPPRDARDSGSARSHSTHLETSSSDLP